MASNYISLIPTYRSLYNDVKRQKVFIKNVIEPEIQQASKTNDGSLDKEDFNKIRNYYGFGVPSIVGEGICTLHNHVMTQDERMASTFQGALTGLYDDFFDKTMLEHAEIRKMMDNPSGYKPGSSLEKLFIHFLKTIHKHLPDKENFSRAFDSVFTAQVDTAKQAKPGMSWDEIRDITFRKGGLSLLFYRSAFAHKMLTGEEEALFNAGALMQLGNDIFDVYKDAPQQIRTLLTSCQKIDEVRKVFESQLARTISFTEEAGFHDRDKKKFLNKLLLGISRCYVCLDQLERLEKKSGGIFTPSAYSREAMICDMEKPRNMISAIRYYLGYKL